MDAAIIGTLVAIGVFVAALATYLIVVATTLRRAASAVGRILTAIDQIAERSQPLEGLVAGLNEELEAVREELAKLELPERVPAAAGRRRRGQGRGRR